jgi:HAE1 family hydrophobic/amphiphilic exporter-1
MQKLAEICVRRPVFASVLTLALLVLGFVSYFRLGVDRFPKVDFPTVVVLTRQPGAGPEELETEVTDKIEESVNTIGGIDRLESTTSEGVSQVVVTFVLEKDPDVGAQEVRDKVNLVLPELPRGIDPPTVEKFDPDSSPVLSIALSAPRPLREISEFADKTLRRRIESISGVGQVALVGDRQRQVNVWLDPEKLHAYGLTATDTLKTLQAQNIQVPGGAVERGSRDVTLRTRGRVQSVPDFERLVLANQNGHQVTLGDVGTVEDGAEKAESIASVDGVPAVVLNVRKQSGTNTVAVVDAVKHRLDGLRQSLPQGYRMEIVRDQSVFIEAATHAVQEHLILGSFLAALVVMLFLGNLRSTIIAAVAIPTSIVATFAVMHALGFTLNVLTLLALTLSVGIVIDDAIVVLENVFRHISEKGMTPVQAAIEGTREIGLAVLATTLSLVAVFLPVAFMGGIVGRFMNSFGLTMAFAIMVSLFVSFTLTPSLCARWLRSGATESTPDRARSSPLRARARARNRTLTFPEPSLAPMTASRQRPITSTSTSTDRTPNTEHPTPRTWVDAFYRPIESGYDWLLRQAMRRRWVVVAACGAALFSVGPLLQAVPKNFLPEDDESQFEITVRAPEGTSLRTTQRLAGEIADGARALPGVRYAMTTVGSDAQRTANLATVYVRLAEIEQRRQSQQALMGQVRSRVLPRFAGRGLRLSV